MTAAAHTWLRLRRWWAISCMQARQRQLDDLVASLEAHITVLPWSLASKTQAMRPEERLNRPEP